MKLSDRELDALEVLADHYDAEGNCLYFKTIAESANIPLNRVRRTVRSLARKGFAEYVRGLFDSDGMVAGSGYCCTRAGYDLMQSSILALEKIALGAICPENCNRPCVACLTAAENV